MSVDFLKQRFHFIAALGFLIGLALQLLYASNQILTGDQIQMLEKGYLAAYEEIWLAFGNAASAVGNVPGYLSAVVIGAPLVLWDSPWSPMLFLILLRSLSFLLFDSIIKQIFSTPTRLAFLVLYWLNPWFLYDTLLYNPAYLIFFAALHFWSAYKLKDKPSFIYSFLHILSIGLAMQLHYSWPVLAVISTYLFYRKMVHFSWSGIITAIGLLLISLIPYFQEVISNEQIQKERADRYIGYGAVHVYPVIKAFIYWLRYSSSLFSNQIILEAQFYWLSDLNWLNAIIKYLWQALLFMLGALSLLLSVRSNWQAFKRIKSKLKRNTTINEDKEWLLLFAFAAVLGIIISAMLSPITFSYWHLILIFPLALIPLLDLIEQWQQKETKKFFHIIWVLAVFFFSVNLVAANDSENFSYQISFSEQVGDFLQQEK